MKKRDPAIKISNPRLLSAIYFGLLSVVGTILINAFLTSIGIQEIIPVFKSILIGMIVASAAGAIYGEQIVHCKKPYLAKTFWLGFSMVIASLPMFVLGLVLFMEPDSPYMIQIVKVHDLVYFYLVALSYSYILYGVLLAVASGLAAMYLRGRLVYDILHTDEEPRKVRKSIKPELHDEHPHKVRVKHH